jgi:hypothetical protein
VTGERFWTGQVDAGDLEKGEDSHRPTARMRHTATSSSPDSPVYFASSLSPLCSRRRRVAPPSLRPPVSRWSAICNRRFIYYIQSKNLAEARRGHLMWRRFKCRAVSTCLAGIPRTLPQDPGVGKVVGGWSRPVRSLAARSLTPGRGEMEGRALVVRRIADPVF